MTAVTIDLNGVKIADDVEPRQTLADFLRDRCGLTATHLGCEHGACGACTVEVDGKATRSCLVLAVMCDGRSVFTLEGLRADPAMAVLRKHFHESHALQCGFCTPGMLIMARDILQRLCQAGRADRPSRAERADLPLHRLRQYRQSDRRGRRGAGECDRSAAGADIQRS